MFKYLFGATVTSRLSITFCRAKSFLSREKFPYHRYIKIKDYQAILMNNLGMTASEARRVLWHQQSIFEVPKDHLVTQCLLCKKYSIDTKMLFKDVALLKLSSRDLESRVLLLQEMGVTSIHTAMVSRFVRLMKMKMNLFKAYMNLPKEENVAANLLSHLDHPPQEIPPLEKLSENLTVTDYNSRCLQWYIEWKLNIPKDEQEELRRMLLSISGRSFSFTRRLIEILHDEIGLSVDVINKYDCLKSGSPDDLRRIIDEIKMLGSVDVKRLIKAVPILHKMEYSNVIEVKKLLNDYDFSNKWIRRCPAIFLIPKRAIAERLEIMQKTPELRVLSNNEKSLHLIWLFKSTQSRLSYLRYLKINMATVRSLTGAKRNFKRFVRTSRDHTRGREIGYSLAKILNLKPTEIRRRIEKHKYWRHISLVTMHENLNFLLQTFKLEDIQECIQLILYPREKIEETLKNLPEMNQKLSNDTQQYSEKYILAVCLYEMEREYNFSGDGVWSYDTELSSRPDTSKKSENELSYFSDSECSETDENDDPKKTVCNQ